MQNTDERRKEEEEEEDKKEDENENEERERDESDLGGNGGRPVDAGMPALEGSPEGPGRVRAPRWGSSGTSPPWAPAPAAPAPLSP